MSRLVFLYSVLITMAFPAYAQTAVEQSAPAFNAAPSNLTQTTLDSKQIEVDLKARQEERDADLADGGLKWLSWSQAGKKVQEFVLKRQPSLKEDPYMQPPENGVHYDFAITDLDQDNLPDVVLYRWAGCGSHGCAFTVIFNNETRKPATYYGFKIRPYEKGIMLDDTTYYSS